jgi:hypothetical protein
VFAQETCQRCWTDAPEQLPQGDFDDRTLADAAPHGDAAQFFADLAGKIYGNTLRVVGIADTR